MLKQLGWVVLAGSLVLTAALPAPAADAKIRVLLIDGQNNHDWRKTTPIMKQALEDCGRFSVEVATSPEKPAALPKPKDNNEAAQARYKEALAKLKDDQKHYAQAMAEFHPDLGKYEVVVSNYNGDPWSPLLQKDLEEKLSSGQIGLVIVHAANNSFSGWGEYNRMIGMGWRDNKFGDRITLDENGKEVRVAKGKGPGAGHGARHPFVVTIRDSGHPVTRGMPHEWLHAIDELYHGMRGPAENVHLLATTFDDPKYSGTGEHEPMIWTVSYGKGRVFHTPMGHDVEAMRCLGFIRTLQRGTEWAATGKVTLALPKDFPTAEKTSTLPAK